MDTTTLAHPAPHPAPEKPRGLRPCAACGEPSGSISAGAGYPVVRERATGRYYHVRCRPASRPGTVAVILGAAL